ncbi:MAG: HEAT repeat domain-containing protein [Myxococcota bacterium]
MSWAGALLSGLALSIVAGAASAHLAVSTRSLSMLLSDADLVVVAEPLVKDAGTGAAGASREVVRARVLEVLKGPKPAGELRFAQHGHGVAEYSKGQIALLFLRRIDRSRELANLADEVEWYSTQERDDAYRMSPKERSKTIELAKAYLRAAKQPAAARTSALGRVTVRMLTSNDPRLVESALHDLVMQPNVPLITEKDVPALLRVVRGGSLPIGSRLALLSQLQSRGLVDGTREWVTLLRSTSGSDQRAVVRASKNQSSEAVTKTLLDLLRHGQPPVAAEAAGALGRPGSDVAVDALEDAALNRPAPIGKASVRSLGGIRTPAAYAALSKIATTAPDESVRKRASAELRKLGE